MSTSKFTIGIDYGSDSVRALLVNTSNGDEVTSAVHPYSRWAKGMYCDPANNIFRQHPLDYIEGLEKTVKEILANCPTISPEQIVAITVDTTGSTPAPVNEKGEVLSLTPEFAENPNAMFLLWKDHSSLKEAAEINELSHSGRFTDYTKYEGGIYSSEWFWSKVLHVLRIDKKVKDKAFSWVEHCDWLPALLTGTLAPKTMKRSRCAAGHKAMWHESWNGLPSEEFLVALDPLLKGLRENLYSETVTAECAVGRLTPEWASRLGLTQNTIVTAGAFDAHMGAVGGEIEPYSLLKVMGTSTCDMLTAPLEGNSDKLIKGICGQVEGSIVPGMLGLEAGQSAFGDIYAWFRRVVLWPITSAVEKSGDPLSLGTLSKETKELLEKIEKNALINLEAEALQLGIGETGVLALDWMNGRRTPDANQELTGAIFGLNLGSTAPMIYRALVESTAYGAKKIVDRFISEGIAIKSVIALGGVAKKSPFVMQCIADVLDMPVRVVKSEQACALGAAMFAAVAARIYPNVSEAMKKMGGGFEKTWTPIPENSKKYKALYEKYSRYALLVETEIMKK